MSRIRPDLAGTKKALALGSYAKKKDFPLDDYFDSIDAIKVRIEIHRPRLGGDADAVLLASLSGLFTEDEAFLTHVIGIDGYDMSGDDGGAAWKRACEALAWTVIQEYDKACEAKRWPKT